MVAALRSWRLRGRLYLVWLLTRHPRFKPLYYADIVSSDPLKQAEHLADAGYLPAAALLARSSLEGQIKRVCLLSPNWRACPGKDKFSRFVGFLKVQGLLYPDKARRADQFWNLACELTHGKGVTHRRCQDMLFRANELRKLLGVVTRDLLASEQQAASWDAAVDWKAKQAKAVV